MKNLVALFFALTSTFLYAENSFNDTDGDGVEDSVDNCPNTYNVLQLDTNGDGIGDACQVSYIDERCVYEYTFTTQYEITRLFLNGEDVNDQSGRSISLSSDGNRVAIGAVNNDAVVNYHRTSLFCNIIWAILFWESVKHPRIIK